MKSKFKKTFIEFIETEVLHDPDNGFDKYMTMSERNLSIYQLLDRYNKKYNKDCDHNFPTYFKNQKRNYKPCEFCGIKKEEL